MSNGNFTEVTKESWFSRIGGAIKGILVGLVLFVAAFPLLFWNEGRAVETYKALEEGAGIVVSVPSDRVNVANANKLIHVTAKANVDATLTDPVFGVSATALKLKRDVEIYQWRETSESKKEKTLGGGETTTTTYSYSKVWSDGVIDSTDFKQSAEHHNSGTMLYKPTLQVARRVTLGAFELSPSLVSKINNFETLPLANDTALPESLAGKAVLHDSGFYVGVDPTMPQIGDLRINFKAVQPTSVSVIAKQVGETFEPYRAKSGGTVELLHIGVHSADAMIQKAQDSNKTLTWILRLVGFAVMFLGLSMIFKLLSVLADVVPILGSIVGFGTGIVSFLLASILSLITIAIAWLFYRPLVAIILIVIAVALSVVILRKLKSPKAAV